MARWKLTAAHYLSVPGTKYRHRETDSTTGEEAEQDFLVPRHLDPKDPPIQSRRLSNGIIYVHQGSGKVNGDFTFEGPPTPDMEPMDDEAREISESYADQWKHPIESLGGEDYGTAVVLRQLEVMMREVLAGRPGGAVSTGGVSTEDFNALKAQVEALINQNAQLQEQLTQKSERRA